MILLAHNGLLAVLLDEVAAEREALVVTLKLDVGALVGKGGNRTLDNGAYRVFLLDGVPRIRGELLVAKAELVVGLVEVKDLNVDDITRRNEL